MESLILVESFNAAFTGTAILKFIESLVYIIMFLPTSYPLSVLNPFNADSLSLYTRTTTL